MKTILFTKTELPQEQIRAQVAPAICNFIDVIRKEKLPIAAEAYTMPADAYIFTSIAAAHAIDIEKLKNKLATPVLCVGEKSAGYFADHGFRYIVVADSAKNLLDKVKLKFSSPSTFIHFCSDIALDTLSKGLTALQHDYHQIHGYRTLLLSPKIDHQPDAAVFFSPCGVRSFAAHQKLSDYRCFAIGETTANEIFSYGGEDVLYSQKNSLDDLLVLIQSSMSKTSDNTHHDKE